MVFSWPHFVYLITTLFSIATIIYSTFVPGRSSSSSNRATFYSITRRNIQEILAYVRARIDKQSGTGKDYWKVHLKTIVIDKGSLTVVTGTYSVQMKLKEHGMNM
jgi:hypothetical protein